MYRNPVPQTIPGSVSSRFAILPPAVLLYIVSEDDVYDYIKICIKTGNGGFGRAKAARYSETTGYIGSNKRSSPGVQEG
jgi:hypothetical protein